MKFLAIDTSGKEVLVVARNEDACSIVEIMPEINVSTSVMGAISQALADVSLTPAELEMIAAVVGPGSFTGLRIGSIIALKPPTVSEVKCAMEPERSRIKTSSVMLFVFFVMMYLLFGEKIWSRTVF